MYKIPPRQSARGYRLTLMGNGNGNVLAMGNLLAGEKDENYEYQCRAADWNLSTPDWTGRMRVMEKSQKVDKTKQRIDPRLTVF